MEAGCIYVSAGRDYRVGIPAGWYSYCLYRGEDVVEQVGGFLSKAAAKRAGMRQAQALAAHDAMMAFSPVSADVAAMSDAELLAALGA